MFNLLLLKSSKDETFKEMKECDQKLSLKKTWRKNIFKKENQKQIFSLTESIHQIIP